MRILENENLIIESKSLGAELTRIYSKKNNKEILWNGDSKYWGRHSPVLFPIVGRLKDNNTIIDDITYNMSQHGFARDMDFEIIESDNESITYKLRSNDETKKMYPYSFELLIKYTLLESSICIKWQVKNIDTTDMYFSIGAHPAFNIPMNENETVEDYHLVFSSNKCIENIKLNGPYYDVFEPVESLNNIKLSAELFKNDALIYTNIDAISVQDKEHSDILKVEFNNFPLVGIWSPYYKDTKTIAPFLCIEPWYGLADSVNTNYEYRNKKYINKINAGEVFDAEYKIIVF